MFTQLITIHLTTITEVPTITERHLFKAAANVLYGVKVALWKLNGALSAIHSACEVRSAGVEVCK